MATLLGVATLLPAAPAAAADTPASAVELTVGGLTDPADLAGQSAATFSWVVPSGEMQSAYQIGVASTAALAAAGTWDVWDSGRVTSAEQSFIPYAGSTLGADDRYYWSIRYWNADDEAADWAALAHFGLSPVGTWSQSSPIWASGDASSWGDFTLTTNVTITANAAGVRFRTDSSNSGYMWQILPAGVKPHKQTNGTFATLVSTNGGVVPFPSGVSVSVGTPFELKIEATGSTFRTYINGTLAATTVDSSFSAGTIGVRTGLTETFTLDDLLVTSTTGSTLFQDDFSGANPFACGTVSSGVLSVGTGQQCLRANVGTPTWLLARGSAPVADKEIAWASLFATGSEYDQAKQYVYKAYVNGEYVGLGPTNNLGSETRFDGFDVTSLLERGAENVVSLIAYNAHSNRKVQAQLVVEYADGTRDVFGTGATWKVFNGTGIWPEGGSIGTSYFSAPRENFNALNYPWGWQEPGFDASSWSDATVRPASSSFTATPMGKVEQQLRDAVQIVDKGNGNYFIDFGRTWAGGIHWDIANGVAGQQTTVRFGEVTSSANTVKYQLHTGNVYEDKPTLKSGAQTIETWGLRVFRYVEVLNSPEPITVDSLKALALVYPFDESASSLDASDNGLEQVYALSKNTIESTNVNFYTDSWTRERTNYEADAYLQLMSSLYVMQDLSLGRYSFEYFKTNRTWPTEWPFYVILAVHDAWRQTGDVSQLDGFYTSLQSKLPDQWFEASTGLIRKTSGSNGCNSTTNCDIVDWPTSQRDGFVFGQYNTVVNAVSYRAYRDMAEIATELGKTADAQTYTARADAIRDAVNTRFYNATTGAYDDGANASLTPTGHYSLHASAFSLAFGLVPDEHLSKTADYVASRGMACSVYCAAFVVQGLYNAGSGDAAYDLLTATGNTSWLGMIAQGAGSTMEAWNPAQKSNLTFSHPWAASPAFNIPAGTFGIQPEDPGYRTFRVKPSFGTLEHGRMTVPTIKGRIGVAFETAGDDLRMAVGVPGNTRATVSYPTDAADGQQVTLYVNGAATPGTAQGGYVTVENLASGCHVLGADAAAGSEYLLDACETAPVVAPQLTVDVTTTTRCVVGKVALVVQATNTSEVPVSVNVSTPYGTKQFTGLAAGRTASQAFSTRLATMPAGTVNAQVTGEVDGQPVSDDLEVAYPTASCS